MVVLVNRAKVATASTGTGTITLGAAESGYQTFADAGVSNGDIVRYVITDGAAWEIGSGAYSSVGATLSRSFSESSTGSLLNLTGSAVVFVAATAADLAALQLYGENPSSPTAPSATGTNAVAIGSGATASGLSSAAIGTNANAGSSFGTAIGLNTAGSGSVTATGAGAMALGGSYASGNDSFAAAIGNNTSSYGATGTNSVAIGKTAKATANSTVAIGDNAKATAVDGVALGDGAWARGDHTFAVFGDAQPSSTSAVAIGGSSVASGNYALSLGYSAYALAVSSISLGKSRASGTDSFAAAITNNTSSYGASGANSVAIGNLAKATQTYAGTLAGFRGQATGVGATSVGGFDNIASGSYSIALGGRLNTSDGKYSYALGYGSHTQGIDRRISFAGNGTSGETQSGWFSLGRTTADATPIALTTDNSTASTDNQVILPNNSAYAFHGTIVARQQASAGTASAAWKVEGLIRREGSAGTTVLVNSATTVIDNTPGWGMALTADTTNGGLAITVTGAASTNIRWVSTIHTSEVTY